MTTVAATSTAVTLSGWASDPDTSAAIQVQLTVDGQLVYTVNASRAGSTHNGHNFAGLLRMPSGAHTICAIGLNVLYGTRNSAPSCATITLVYPPIGAFETLTRATGSTNCTSPAGPSTRTRPPRSPSR